MKYRLGFSSVVLVLVASATGVFLWSQTKDGAVTLASSVTALNGSFGATETPTDVAGKLPALPEGASEAWLAAVQDDLKAQRWGVRPVDDSKPADINANYWAPNSTHNIDTWFTPEGIAVRPHNAGDAEDSWTFAMSLAGVGSSNSVMQPDVPVQVIDGNRVEYQRGNITEWYINDGKGLEQGFTISAPPLDVTDELVLAMNVEGNLNARILSDGLVALDNGDADVDLYMRNLVVIDANDQLLAANFTTVANQLAISVDVSDAAYPIVVDPIISAFAAFLEADHPYANFGESVASAGDVNGDGYGDVIVGAPEYSNGLTDEGAVYVFYGSASGLSTAPDWQAESNSNGAQMGYSVASAGDIDNDGFDDVIAGAPYYDNGQINEGALYVYYGSETGPSNTPQIIETNHVAGYFGWSVAPAGSVNGDVYADVIVGAPFYDNGQTDEGAASSTGRTPHLCAFRSS